jgi:predicted dehydrogenase
MRKLGIGVIGLGQIGKVHLQNCLKLENAFPVAACDSSRKALKIAEKSGIKKTFTSYEDLLKDPDVDAVVIALPTHLHGVCAKIAAEEKKHVLLEKPLAANVGDGKEILNACERNGIKLMVGYPLRFDSRFLALKKRVVAGFLGEVEVAHAVNISCGPFFSRQEGFHPAAVPDWWFNPHLTGGGALMDLGSHMIDLLRWYFGEIDDVKCSLGFRYNLDVEDSANCLMRFRSGVTGIVSVGWFSQEMSLKVELFGTVKSERSIDLKSNPLLSVVQSLTSGTSKFFLPHLDEVKHFVNCLIRDKDPSPSGHEGLIDLEVIAKAYANKILWNKAH